MKKFFLLFIISIAFLFPAFSQNRILLTDEQSAKLLNAPKLLDSSNKKINIQEIYRCSNVYVPENLRGTYFFFSSMQKLTDGTSGETFYSSAVYVENDADCTTVDFLKLDKDIALLPARNLNTAKESDFLKFDSYGNAFCPAINTNTQCHGVAVFYPGSGITKFFPLPVFELAVQDFEISDDGRWLLINGGMSDHMKEAKPEKSNLYLYDTFSVSEPETLFPFKKDYISQIRFNSADNCFYFLCFYKDDARDTGICVLSQKNGKYSPENLMIFPAKEQGLSFFDFQNAVLVKDYTNQKLYASDCLSGKESSVYEIIRDKDRISFAIPNNLGRVLVKKQTQKPDEHLIGQNVLGIYIRSDSIIHILRNGHLTSYKNEAEYEKILEQAMRENVKIKERPETMPGKMIFVLVILIFVLLVAVVVFVILIRTIRNNKKGLDQKQILRIQEEEKARISRDIHDTVVQDLRAIRVEAESLQTSDSVTRGRLVDDITNCIVKMRNICYSLTPAELATAGEADGSKVELIYIIDTLCRQFYTKTKIPCSIQTQENFVPPVFEKDVCANVVRVFQEILSNIEKHSYATKVTVLVRTMTENDKKYCVIFVIDDGVGCNLNELKTKKRQNHFGMQNMKDRMKHIGSSIEFFSMPDEGMKVKLTIEIQ